MHTYANESLMGVCVAATYKGDVREALKLWRDPAKRVITVDGRVDHADSVIHQGTPVALTVSYVGDPADSSQIVVSALGYKGKVDENSLKVHLETLLKTTGIGKKSSERDQFAELFARWANISEQVARPN